MTPEQEQVEIHTRQKKISKHYKKSVNGEKKTGEHKFNNHNIAMKEKRCLT